MRLVDEFRAPGAVDALAKRIGRVVTRPWRIMEVCGGQTHAIVRFGIDQMLPPTLSLLHGPGCPVCVTPIERIDRALFIASRAEVVLCSFGDMLRVPGSETDLLGAKGRGADVRVVFSPLDALAIAEREPQRQVVFFAVGFETTAPAIALAAERARQTGIENFSLLVAHVLVPPALEAVLGDPECRVDGFLAAGHVCTIMGLEQYRPIAKKYRVPIVATGFEPTDLLQGILLLVEQLESGRHEVENQYTRAVTAGGNAHAQSMLARVFEVVPRAWRGLGEIPRSGLGLRAEYRSLDADLRFPEGPAAAAEPEVCRAGRVLRGIERPTECPAFGSDCTPAHPLGAPMVSSEGACAAYYRFRSPA